MRVGIVGGGFAGLAAGIAFRQHGHDVTVFEKADGAPDAGGAISLAPNALKCLSLLGVRAHIQTQPWSDMPATVRSSNGRVLIRRTLAQLTGGEEYATVPRSQLISMLAAQLPPDCLHNSNTVTALRADGTVDVGGTTHRLDLVVGADGARGISRTSLCPDAAPLRSTGIRGWAWIVDREMSSGFGPIWGRTADFGILPLPDGRTYVYGGRVGVADLKSFRGWPDPLPALIDAAIPEQMATPEIFEARPPRDLVHGRAVLIGDAAHTMRPTFGQGAALAMEDAITLASLGAEGFTRRWARMLTLYLASKAGSYFATPRLAPLEFARNTALRFVPDAMFGLMAGAVSDWQPPD